MFRNSAWFLCAFLLCFGQALSQNGAPVNVAPEVHEDKTSVDSHLAPPDPVVHSEAKLTPTPETPDVNNKTTPSNNTSSSTTTKPTSPVSPSSSTIVTTPTSTAKSTSAVPPSTSSAVTTPSTPPAPTSSTPIPVTPKPDPPQKGSWNVTIKNITCLRIDGIFSIDYTYSIGNKTNEKVHYDVPKGANSAGNCNEISLNWKYNNTAPNQLKFIFKKSSNTSYVLHSFDGFVYVPKLNKTEHFNTNVNETYFNTPIGQSYSCSSMKKVTVNQHAAVTLDEFHLQAFKTSNTTGFDESVDCAPNTPHTADIVPIVVGCVLALLVIAVLVAYLISRRRSQTRGYLSM